MNKIEQTPEVYNLRWKKIISLLPTGGDYRLDNRARAWRIIADYIGEDKKVFEFATGVSYLPEYLDENGCKVSGCDFSSVAVDYASKWGNFKETGEIFGSGYDYVTACQFIEHIEDPATWVKDALSYAPEVICSIPNNFRQVGDHYLMQWKNWDEFYKLFEDLEIERLDKPENYAGNPTAWNHPIFIFRKKTLNENKKNHNKGGADMHISTREELNKEDDAKKGIVKKPVIKKVVEAVKPKPKKKKVKKDTE